MINKAHDVEITKLVCDSDPRYMYSIDKKGVMKKWYVHGEELNLVQDMGSIQNGPVRAVSLT